MSEHAEDSEVGKAHDTGQDGTEGRRPHRPLRPDTVGPEPQKPTSLRGRATKANADTRHRWRELSRGVEAALVLDCWQARKKAAARGVEHVTADASAATLQGNSAAVGPRVQTKRSRATVLRRCAMPKANGTDRPLGMPALEDTLGPLACATRCTAISAQDFLAGSDGSRPGRGALEAVRDRTLDRQSGRDGSLGEAAVQGCVEHMDHLWR